MLKFFNEDKSLNFKTHTLRDMPLNFVKFTFLLFSSLVLAFWFCPKESTHQVENPISIRESTVDLQLRVGEQLFVFGKASGGLEKIKIGMKLLDFHQLSSQDFEEKDTKLQWKRNRNGSILIQKIIDGKINSFWTVFPSGILQFENLSPISSGPALNFKVLEEILFSCSWVEENQTEFTRAFEASQQKEISKLSIGNFEALQLKFEDLNVRVTPFELKVSALLSPNSDQTKYENISFGFHQAELYPSAESPNPSSSTSKSKATSQNLKLKFEFYQ